MAAEISPVGELEHALFDTLLHAHWNIRRCRLLEACLLRDGADPLLLPEQNEAKLRQLDRHARRHEANFHRALRELRSLQTERVFRTLPSPATTAQNEPTAAPLANTLKARQTRVRELSVTTRVNSGNLDRALNHALHRLTFPAPNSPDEARTG